MKVLVIGSSGFIGQALVSRLLAAGHTVEAWDRREGEATPVSDLVQGMLKAMGRDSDIHFANTTQTSLVGDPGQLMRDTGWRPRRSLRDTVAAILRVSPGQPLPHDPEAAQTLHNVLSVLH